MFSFKLPLGKNLFVRISSTGIRLGIKAGAINTTAKIASFKTKKEKTLK